VLEEQVLKPEMPENKEDILGTTTGILFRE
jgi:hypothetical protein